MRSGMRRARALERQPHVGCRVHRRRAAARTSDRRARRELGSHCRQGSDRADSATPTSCRTRRCATISPGITSIGPERVVVSGWPQTDMYASGRRPREEYEALVRTLGLDPERPARRWSWATRPRTRPSKTGSWSARGGSGRQRRSDRAFAALSPPSPRREWRERFAAALGDDGVAVQEASFTDFEVLATLLQHCGCVVDQRGDDPPRRARQRSPGGLRPLRRGCARRARARALKNVIGEHYRELAASEGVLPRGVVRGGGHGDRAGTRASR